MDLTGRKLGLMISAPPDSPNFDRALRLAESALARGVNVYVYCLDEAVRGLSDQRLQALKTRGVKLFACAYAAQRRRLAVDDRALFGGLSLLNDCMADTDRFLSFN